MKNVTLSLLAAAGIGAISIGSVSAMPVSNLNGLSESHVQDVRLVCDRFGRCYNTRRAYRSYPYAQRYYGEPSYGYYSGYGRGYYSGWSWLRILRRTACRNWYRPGRRRHLSKSHSHLATTLGPPG